jgi:NYN domain
VALYLYVDNSNVWIEGRRVSAVKSGLAPTMADAMRNNIVDNTWTYDFGELYRLACPAHETLGRTALFGSTPPPSDSIWDIARNEGFDVRLFPRNASNKEKQVDNAIGTLLLEDSYEHMKPGDVVVLAAGDGDFIPNLESVKRRGFLVRLIFWSHAAPALRNASDEFVDLDLHFDTLSRS